MPKLVESLVVLRAQINKAYPKRDKKSDGWVGDATHKKTKSDHNPDANGYVHAIDVDGDGIPADNIVKNLTDAKDYRLKFVIWENNIWYPSTAKWSKYTGLNPHTSHFHVSVYPGIGMHNTEWFIDEIGIFVHAAILSNHGMTREQVMQVKAVLNRWYPTKINLVMDDGYSNAMFSAVRFAQGKLGVAVDGIAGPITRNKLGIKF